jgi:hypothetical protein
MRVSDISGEVIPVGTGASVKIDVHGVEEGSVEFDVTAQELVELFDQLPLELKVPQPIKETSKSAMERAKEK